MRRLALIVVALVIFAIIEISVLIAIGHIIGLGWALLLMLSTSLLGGWLLRQQGGRAWRAFRDDVCEARPPGNAGTEGLLVLIGGVFMLVPGFVSDLIGLVLITPPSRRAVKTFVVSMFATRISSTMATSLFGPRRVRVRHASPGPNAGEPLEGEVMDP